MINGKERVCVQGITGKYGQLHTKKMLDYGTQIVCGVSKNKEITHVHGVPVYTSMKDAVEKEQADTSVIFVAARFAKEAAFEAMEAGIKKIVIITEHIPQHDMLAIYRESKKLGVKILGPNGPGVILPGKSKIGIMPDSAFKQGDIAIISRSGTLMYEISNYLSKHSTGVKIAIGLGGDPIIGTSVSEAFDYVMAENINKVIVIGEVGGTDEIEGIKYALKKGYQGSIKSFFAGRTAPKGKTMGHAGAIVEGKEGTIEEKERVLKELGIFVATQVPELV